jgi:uncharacterized phage-associated protein
MAIPFDEQKATEATAYLLKLRGGQMSYMKLIKLLYLADREALNRWGFPLTTDWHSSMPHGPVVSNIYDLIRRRKSGEYWTRYISEPFDDKQVQLERDDCPTDKLSRAEESLLVELFDKYKTWTRWQLRDLTHELPEWEDPAGSSIPIGIDEILRAQGATDEEIRDVQSDLRAVRRTKSVLRSAK